MKLFAGILTLAVFAGVHGRRLPQNDPKSNWEIAVDKVKDYFKDLGEQGEEWMQDLQESEITKELDQLIEDSMAELAMYRDEIQNKLAPYAKGAVERAGRDLQRLYDKLIQHMEEGKEEMEKYREELQVMVEQNVEDVQARVLAYTRKLRKRLQKDTQEIQRQVADYFEDIQIRASNQLEGLKSNVEPLFSDIYYNAMSKFTSLADLWRSQSSNIKDKLQDAAEDIQGRIENTAGDLWGTLGDKMKELQDWFQPVVALFNGED